MRSDLDYSKITADWERVLTYLFHSADSFSVITTTPKPFAPEAAPFEHAPLLEPLRAFCIEEKIGCREWPGTRTRDTRKVYCRFKACSRARDIVLQWGNPFRACELHLPEDICFYRGDDAVFFSVSHEGYAEAMDDAAFFRNYCRNVQA